MTGGAKTSKKYATSASENESSQSSKFTTKKSKRQVDSDEIKKIAINYFKSYYKTEEEEDERDYDSENSPRSNPAAEKKSAVPDFNKILKFLDETTAKEYEFVYSLLNGLLEEKTSDIE